MPIRGCAVPGINGKVTANKTLEQLLVKPMYRSEDCSLACRAISMVLLGTCAIPANARML